MPGVEAIGTKTQESRKIQAIKTTARKLVQTLNRCQASIAMAKIRTRWQTVSESLNGQRKTIYCAINAVLVRIGGKAAHHYVWHTLLRDVISIADEK